MNTSPAAILLSIAVLFLTGCHTVTTEPLCGSGQSSANRIVKVEYGTSFGFCAGYCWSRMTISDSGTTFTKGGWNNAVEEVTCTGGIPCPQWSSVADSIDLSEFFALEETIGCPDCADGGAEWIEIETLTATHRVTYEYGHPPAVLLLFADKLSEMKSSFNNCE